MDPLESGLVLKIRQDLWQQILEDVEYHAPIEACGLLAGKNGEVTKVYPIANALASPVRFRMAPDEQLHAFMDIDAQSLDLLAIYHSHPNGPPQPSPTDLDEFAYPGVLYLICHCSVSGWSCSCFNISGSHFESARFEFIPGE